MAMDLNENVLAEKVPFSREKDRESDAGGRRASRGSNPETKIIFERLVECDRCDLSIFDSNGNSVLIWAIERSLVEISVFIVKVCAVDAVWSGLKLMIRKENR